ncbi:carboxypeptidase-like regulatory domain-containing protein [Niabella drilacis]|nr:carboxypeptidase-like regulatory domain-containing protein [Niabella drilacis]
MILLFALIFCWCRPAGCQGIVTGEVIDSISGKPVEGASIYFNGLQSGTTTSVKGFFTIEVPVQPQLLIISATGYQTVSLRTNEIPGNDHRLLIKMAARNNDLDMVTVHALTYKVVNSRSWRKKFTDYFIGSGENAADCSILNFEDIILKVAAGENLLKAQAAKTIEIVNNALGYKIYFDMEDCVINFAEKTFVNVGYARFEDISNGSHKFKKRRKEVYFGSLPHFLKALYNNTLQANGFEVRHATVKENTERARVKQLMKEKKVRLNIAAEMLRIGESPPDSSLYYYRVYIKGKDKVIQCDSSLLKAEDVFITDLEVMKELYFEHYLMVTYKHKRINKLRQPLSLPGLDLNSDFQNALLSLKDNNSVFIFPNGGVSPARVLITQGYWSSAGAIQNLLPYDYE